MGKAIAVKIDYISPRTGERNESTQVLMNIGNQKPHVLIEALQERIKSGHVLTGLPSVTWQVCNNMVEAMIATTKL